MSRAFQSEFGVGRNAEVYSTVGVTDGNFDYNEKVMVETAQVGSRSFSIGPIGGVVNQAGPFTFRIEPMGDSYLQLNRARLEARCRVVKPNGENISLWEDVVAPVNLLGATMWETCTVLINTHDRVNGSAATNVGYKAYLETMLSYDSDSRTTQLHTQFFNLDSPGQFNNMKAGKAALKQALYRAFENGEEEAERPTIPLRYRMGDHFHELLQEAIDAAAAAGDDTLVDPSTIKQLSEDAKRAKRYQLYDTVIDPKLADLGGIAAQSGEDYNKGFCGRCTKVAGSHQFDMYSPVPHDFFKLSNHIAPGNTIEVRLTPHSAPFLLNSYLGDQKYKLVIDDLKLHLHSIERAVAPPVKELYLMNETQLHKQLVASGSPSTSFRIHNGGIMPKTVVVAMVSVAAAEGSYEENPFQFFHFYAKNMHLMVNGQQVPQGGIETDFTKENSICSRAYFHLFENTGASETSRGNLISYAAYQAGCFIQAWDQTYDKCNGLHNHRGELGYIDLNIQFSLELNEPIYVIYELVFPKVIINDKMVNEVAVLHVA